MEARAQGSRIRRRAATAVLLAGAAAVSLGACGSQKRQDADEPRGRFPIEVVEAKFPERQKLAKRSTLLITVRNAGSRTIPNIAVTVDGFDQRKQDPDLADPDRPVFVVNGRPQEVGGFPEARDAAPPGCDTAYVNTWACGRLKAGEEKTFRWSVSAVDAGPFKIRWAVSAGLDGKAKAVDTTGGRPAGSFAGTISDTPPDSRVANDGETVISGTR